MSDSEQIITNYILEFMLGENLSKHIVYSRQPSKTSKITIIKSSFFDNYGSPESLPKVPFPILPESDSLPFLYGDSKIEYDEQGKCVLHADLIASAFFLMSRYEEMIKKDLRDQWGRFLAKDSVIFQQGYGDIPLIDEWSAFLKQILKKTGVAIEKRKKQFSKIYLTHDIDFPFKLYNLKKMAKQYISRLLKKDMSIKDIFKTYRLGTTDPYFTFPQIIKMDTSLKDAVTPPIEIIYFIIARKGKEYCNISCKKFINLSKLLEQSGATLGLHISHEGGKNPVLIKKELSRLRKYIPTAKNISRNHFLRWREPEHSSYFIQSGLKEDFTLGYADYSGFRTGTCRPYYYIDPSSKTLTNLLIHPLIIMECTLSEQKYMNLNYNSALTHCKNLINQIYKHGGEVNLLWHNTSFMDGSYHNILYNAILKHIKDLCNN